MAPAKYLVTGGAGFIGSHIVETLLKQGESVRVFDNLITGRQSNLNALGKLPGQLEIIHDDLRNLSAVRAAVEGVKIVFHQGALASVQRSITDPVSSLEININGTQNVLVAARDAEVQRVVYASSSAVYGDTPTLPKREEMPTMPLSPYGVHKLTGEFLCKVFTSIYGLETVALRYFNVFGPRQDPASEYAAVIPRFLSALLTKQRPIVYGDGEQTRDFTYVENVVQANLLASQAPAVAGMVLNIGCGEQISLNTVLQTARELLDSNIKADYQEARPGDIRNSLADISRARTVLGYTPLVTFKEGLAQTLDSLRTNLASPA